MEVMVMPRNLGNQRRCIDFFKRFPRKWWKIGDLLDKGLVYWSSTHTMTSKLRVACFALADAKLLEKRQISVWNESCGAHRTVNEYRWRRK
jgi:hypothetical protein